MAKKKPEKFVCEICGTDLTVDGSVRIRVSHITALSEEGVLLVPWWSRKGHPVDLQLLGEEDVECTECGQLLDVKLPKVSK